MHKIYSMIIILLLLVIGAGAYTFIYQGNVSNSQDGRIAIHLNEGERNLVLAEMRAFLESVQQITAAVADDNMDAVAEAARKVGKAAQATVPGSLMGKLPLEFKKRGFDTHTKFDQLALDAESFGDGSVALKQLSELMQNCVACHAGYKLIADDQ